MSLQSQEPYLYFAYGTGLSLEEMTKPDRYPSARYASVARLKGYEWFINTGYCANIRPVSDGAAGSATGTGGIPDDNTAAAVWGIVYWVFPADETAKKRKKGGGDGYEAVDFDVEYWTAAPSIPDNGSHGSSISIPDTLSAGASGTTERVVAYLDPTSTDECHGALKERSVNKLNLAIADARKAGIPEEYLDMTGAVDETGPREEREENSQTGGEVGAPLALGQIEDW